MEKEDAAGVVEDEEQAEKPCREDTPGPMPEHQYTREELFKIANSKLSKRRPSCLDKNFDTPEGLWDPEKWYRALCGGSRENSPQTVMDGRDRDRRRPHDFDRDLLGRNRKTSSSDPRERVKEEQDGIVLSPQRRNFSTGCQVSKTSSGMGGGGSLYRQSSLNDYKERDDRDRDRRDQRRIGSGRIQIDRDQGRDREREYHRFDRDDRDRGDRDRDRGDRDRDRDRMDRDLDRDRNRMDRDRDRRYINDRSDRFRRDNRDFGDKMAERRDRDFRDRDRDRDRDDRRYGGRRRHVEEETPEWFTGGPTSQTETIELRGFEREGGHKSHRNHKEPEEEEEEGGVEEEVVDTEMEYHAEEKPTPAEVDEAGDARDGAGGQGECNGSLAHAEDTFTPEGSAASAGEQSAHHPHFGFDFNQFFNVEHIPGLGPVQDLLPDPQLEGHGLPDPVHSESGSRFSKWFSAQAMGSEHGQQEAGHFTNSNINNNLLINHRNSPANLSDDFNYLNDMLEGSKSPMGPSPPPHGGQPPFGEKPFFHQFPINKDNLTHGPDHNAQHKNFTPIVSALFGAMEKSGNASTPSSRGSFSTQDAEAQLKAMLFGGARDSASSSGTASPANVPLGVQRKMKTVAELEADLHQNSPQSPASTPHSTPAPMGTTAPPPATARNDDGDQSAFNRLLSLMKVGSGGAGPPVPRMPDQRSLSPSFGIQAHNEFTQALLRNREQQRQIQQQTLQSMQQPPLPPSQLSSSPAQAQAEAQAQVQQLHHQLQQQQQQQQQASLQAQGVISKMPIIQHPSQQAPQQPPHIVVPRPVLAQGVGRVAQGQSQDPIINFLQQNPKIVMKPASPIPAMVAGHSSAQGGVPSPLPPGLPPPSIRVTSQQGNNPATARVPSPIMFSQQPPMHLSAPSPIHPVQLGPLAGQALSTNTLTTTSGIRSPVLQRVPSPQELKAHTQAIMQTALIKRKLEDQKERYLKKQQERDKSPSQPQPPTAASKPTVPTTPTITTTTTPNTTQAKPANMAFTPTSVIRKMHSDRVSEKEKQAKESDEDSDISKRSTEKRGSESFDDSAVGSGEMGVETSELHTPSSFTSNLSALSNQMEEGLHLGVSQDDSPGLRHDQDTVEDKVMFGGAVPVVGVKGIPMIRPMVGQPVASPLSATGGRAIVKGSAEPVTTALPMVSLPRPVTGGGTQPPVKVDAEPRPIVGAASSGTGFDLNKLLEQQQQQRLQQQTAVLPPPLAGPLPRPLGAGPAPPPPFMPITPGHIPLQAAATQASMQNAMIMQQISRVNAMNQMNQLAALQAQQRMMDPRLQPLRTVIPTVNPAAPLSPLSPRSSLPSAISGLAPPISSGAGISAGMKRSFSPAHSIFSQANKPVMNGPFSMGVPVSGVPNNSVPSEGEILKWFGPEVLKTQLPSMPPLPTHGTKVMTVDEIERS
ncbi:uncharacterized protein LOC143302173 isoform X2 [Babylonia areolata]|uniref:uncharacterized protein LOC143302173 isoform X2 n=1 Tax=Babylonia areolata TaxID=304850 RepID=UPI003FD0A447